MNMQIKIPVHHDFSGNSHWTDDLPYRAIVPIKMHSPQGPMLFQIAGSTAAACGAEKALRSAMKIHGGNCFYCHKELKGQEADLWTIDHIEPIALGGNSHLPNLVIACKPCNRSKGHQPIDAFNPAASEKWLSELKMQIEIRLKKLRKQP
ncbi:MAG: HNH endonuclease [Sphingomonadales bacterium]|nr:HNH endonuclease [Sphingomonadales bacterium]